MTTTRYSTHIVDILGDIRTKLTTATGLDVFIGERPTNNTKQRNEMLVISLPYSVRQKGAIQTTYLRIEIIVKDKNEGRSNYARLEQLSNQIISLYPIKNERYTTTTVPNVVLSGKDTIGYTIFNMQCGVQINKTDTYAI